MTQGSPQLQHPKKYLEPKAEGQQKWTGQKKFDVYFGVFFYC